MSQLKFAISMSLDGFIAGPNQSVNDPLGVGGERLHEWAFPLKAFREIHGQQGGEVNESNQIIEERFANAGATIMGETCLAATPVRGIHKNHGMAGGERIHHFTILCLSSLILSANP